MRRGGVETSGCELASRERLQAKLYHETNLDVKPMTLGIISSCPSSTGQVEILISVGITGAHCHAVFVGRFAACFQVVQPE
jgi:hypothetical protein